MFKLSYLPLFLNNIKLLTEPPSVLHNYYSYFFALCRCRSSWMELWWLQHLSVWGVQQWHVLDPTSHVQRPLQEGPQQTGSVWSPQIQPQTCRCVDVKYHNLYQMINYTSWYHIEWNKKYFTVPFLGNRIYFCPISVKFILVSMTWPVHNTTRITQYKQSVIYANLLKSYSVPNNHLIFAILY